jgi:Uncharacterised protein family UPF0005.
VAAICTVYETNDIITAAFLAMGLTAILMVYSFFVISSQVTDFEIFNYFGVTLVGLVVLMILDLFVGVGNNKIWVALGLVIYGFYLIIDIHRLLNESRFGMTYDDYIVGAILIYLDIIMIFIKILEILGKKK